MGDFIQHDKKANATTLTSFKKPGALVSKKALAMATFLIFYSSHAGADGALAMTPFDHFVFGFTTAYVVDAPNLDAAANVALLKCRESDSELQSRFSAPLRLDRCKLVKAFSHQCFAVAVDEAQGRGSGGGWAVEDNLSVAESKALAMCKTNTDLGRQDLCQVAKQACDGAAAIDR